MVMERKLQELKMRFLEISDLYSAAALLGWDQMTYMPRAGEPMAVVNALAEAAVQYRKEVGT